MSTLGVGTPNADGWTYAGEVSSSSEQAVLETFGTQVGTYEIQVATYDGEFWSPYSVAVSVSVPATISAGAAGGTAAIPPTQVGQAAVDVPPTGGSGDVATPLYAVEHVLETPPAAGVGDTVSVEPIWTWMGEVTSSSQQFVLDTDGWEPQTYQFEVRTFDGEFWSPWSADRAQFTIPSTVAAPSATAQAGMVPPDNLPDVTVTDAAFALAEAEAPDYSVENILETPGASAVGDIGVVEPIWTWMAEVAASSQSFVLDTDGWPPGTYQFEARTHDGEFWSPWSSEKAQFTIPAIVAAPPASATGGVTPPDNDPDVSAPPSSAAADMPVQGYSVEHILETPAAPAEGRIGTVEPVWTWMSELASGEQFFILDTDGWEPGEFQFEVRTHDGEFWSPWSEEKAQFSIPPTIAAPPSTASAGMVAPNNEPDVTSISMIAAASMAEIAYTTEHVLDVPAALAGADIGTVEPVWTWLDEVSSSTQSATIPIPDGHPVGIFEYQVRTHDGEFWSPWSTETASFEVVFSVRPPAPGGMGGMAPPTINEDDLAVPAAYGGVARMEPPSFNQDDIEVPAFTATAYIGLPDLLVAQTIFPVGLTGWARAVPPTYTFGSGVGAPSATAWAAMPLTQITPVMSNTYLATLNGWEPVTRRLLTEEWIDISNVEVSS